MPGALPALLERAAAQPPEAMDARVLMLSAHAQAASSLKTLISPPRHSDCFALRTSGIPRCNDARRMIGREPWLVAAAEICRESIQTIPSCTTKRPTRV